MNEPTITLECIRCHEQVLESATEIGKQLRKAVVGRSDVTICGKCLTPQENRIACGMLMNKFDIGKQLDRIESRQPGRRLCPKCNTEITQNNLCGGEWYHVTNIECDGLTAQPTEVYVTLAEIGQAVLQFLPDEDIKRINAETKTLVMHPDWQKHLQAMFQKGE